MKEIDFNFIIEEIVKKPVNLSHLFTFLAKYEINIDFNLGEKVIPQTKALLRAKEKTGGVLSKYINDLEARDELEILELEPDTKNRVLLSTLFDNYKFWCCEGNFREMNRDQLKEALINRKYVVKKVGHNVKVTLKKTDASNEADDRHGTVN